ncbi:hypothetical protein GCM10025864_12790 [Luteimicrobium album]|uniref:DUF5134 domain-containing protein n=2 Tax=Luteimicrobium album TaxID=1054550 RepID=A0ABQ6I170_9MICO|nr:hypothetical protein GCM10025864_12790 [Luteimicrobium album]
MATAMAHATSPVWAVGSGLVLLLALPGLAVVLREHPGRGDHLLDCAAMAALLLVPVIGDLPGDGGEPSPHGPMSSAGHAETHGAMSMSAGHAAIAAWVLCAVWAVARLLTMRLRAAGTAGSAVSGGRDDAAPDGAVAGGGRWQRAAGLAVTLSGMALMLPR